MLVPRLKMSVKAALKLSEERTKSSVSFVPPRVVFFQFFFLLSFVFDFSLHVVFKVEVNFALK